jgi:hypothetical protein
MVTMIVMMMQKDNENLDSTRDACMCLQLIALSRKLSGRTTSHHALCNFSEAEVKIVCEEKQIQERWRGFIYTSSP